MTLRQKAISGVLWSSLNSFSRMGLEFVVGVFLARALSPREFGLVGMITVFITISEMFINSGFSQALIRKPHCTSDDYSTAFIINTLVGIVFFTLIFIGAPFVASFYDEPQLKNILRVLGGVVLITSITLIHRTILIREINFKLITKVSVISSFCSGGIAIAMAYSGFGVWSLVAKTLSREGISSFLVWFRARWVPTLTFNKDSFRYLFGFGSNLLLSGVIGAVFQNISYIIVGKYFSAQSLGFYTRAELFKNVPTQSISGVITTVAYPVLAKIQNDPIQFKIGFFRILHTASYLIFLAMFGMASIADSLIMGLIGPQWQETVPLLQLLCVIGLFHPLNSINVNILNVLGRSDLYMKLQLIMQVLIIPVLFVAVFWGIKMMIVAMIVNAFIGYFVFASKVSQLTGCSISEQISGIIPSLILATAMGAVVYGLGWYLDLLLIYELLLQILTGIVFAVLVSELFQLEVYLYLKSIVFQKFREYVG